MSQDNQDITKGACKLNEGKPLLELHPPVYWQACGSELSAQVASWYFFCRFLPRIGCIPFDSTHPWELGCQKYTAHNWLMNGGLRVGAVVGAFHRHYNRYNPNTGLHEPRDLTDINTESFENKDGELVVVSYPHGCAAAWCMEVLNQFKKSDYKICINDCVWNSVL